MLELAQGCAGRVVILGHSKGAVDAAAALSLFPELVNPVAALVSVQVRKNVQENNDTTTRLHHYTNTLLH